MKGLLLANYFLFMKIFGAAEFTYIPYIRIYLPLSMSRMQYKVNFLRRVKLV